MKQNLLLEHRVAIGKIRPPLYSQASRILTAHA
jgi:hypothetical protein